ncbi:MAG: hypothetical protein J6C61_06510 [Clostridia bacterium]|nr:hypothetical protein [Clostridia bacterium]
MVAAYGVTLLLSVGLLIAYSIIVKTKEFWLTLLYACVTIVNLGYLLLSIAKTEGFAIFANDVAYFGSVFLSMCMLLTIVRLCGFKIRLAHIIACVSAGAVMFLIIATAGILPWYYESISLVAIDGATKLIKEYGPLHPVYLVYLLTYFALMIITIILSIAKKKIGRPKFAGFIAGIVCSNIIVWLFEKFVSWDFEFLSVTYIISELLLLLLYWMMQDYIPIRDIPTPISHEIKTDTNVEQKLKIALSFLPEGEELSVRENEILIAVLENKKRKNIAIEMHLSENTVKTYTRNLYNKLRVSSREELYQRISQKQTPCV